MWAGYRFCQRSYMQHTPQEPALDGWARLGQTSFIEVLAQMWARKWMMALVFMVLFALGMAGVMTLKKTYTAQGRVLVQFGEEYIYNPVIGGSSGQGAAYSADQMIQAEVGFLTAAEVKQKVLERIGLNRLYPKLAAELQAKPEKRTAILGAAIHNMNKGLGAYTAPNQPLITVSFRHLVPQVAKDTLNAFIDEYQIYRRKILLDDGTEGFEKERESAAEALRQVNQKLENFLSANGIGDFTAERAAQSTRIASLRDQLLTAQARQREIAGALASLATLMAQTPKTVEQYRDDAGAGQLAALKLQRQQMLAKYTPQSSPVRALDARIARLEGFVKSGRGGSTGTRRTGINTVYQGLQSQKLSLKAEQHSNAAKIAVLKTQINAVRARQQRFQKLYPQYQRLANQAQVMEASYVQFATREQELQARRNLAALKSDNIRVIERPVLPVLGKSLRKPAALLAFAFAAFTAFCVTLLSSLMAIARQGTRRPAPVPQKDKNDKTVRSPAASAPPRNQAAAAAPGRPTAGVNGDLPVLGNIAAQ